MALIEVNKNLSQRELRRFACIWLPVSLLLIAVLFWHRWGLSNTALFIGAVALAIAALGLFSIAFARALYFSWMTAVHPIGWTVSLLLLGTVYFLILTPLGLLMRALGRRPLSLGFDRTAKSYWTPRPDSTNIERYFRQF